MAKLTFVKKVVNDEVINSYNLILNALFGGKIPEIYDENKVYNKGDIVIIQQDGIFKVVTVAKDGVTGPVDPDNFTDIIITDLYKDSSIITQNSTVLQSTQEALSDDVATLVYELAGMLDHRLVLKVLFRENFRDLEHLNLVTGLHVPGSVKALPGYGIDVRLNEPIELITQPKKYKIKHIIEMLGAPTLGCSITFNALDANPHWFNANEAILSADFFEIPEFVKEEGKPYALDIKIFGDCAVGSSLEISDFMVVFI